MYCLGCEVTVKGKNTLFHFKINFNLKSLDPNTVTLERRMLKCLFNTLKNNAPIDC